MHLLPFKSTRKARQRASMKVVLGYEYDGYTWRHHPHMKSKMNPRLKLLTFNVMTDSFSARPMEYKQKLCDHTVRYKYILDELASHDCDIISLNEVTNFFLALLLEEEWVKERYACSHHPTHNPIVKFTNIVLAKTDRDPNSEGPLLQWSALHISGISRKVMCLVYNGVPFLSCHLRAGLNTAHRQKQFEEIEDYISSNMNSKAVLMGDFNILSNKEEYIIPDNYFDCWSVVHPHDHKGFTWDFNSNSMLYHIFPFLIFPYRSRLDRVFVRETLDGEGTQIQPLTIKTIFKDPIFPAKHRKLFLHRLPRTLHWFILPLTSVWRFMRELTGCTPPVESYLFPSDHFGLLAEIKIS